LKGDLGSGKTVLVRGIADALGIAREEIRSPTYTLVHEHDGMVGRLLHLDLYRLQMAELPALGLDEILAGPGVKAVEWAERLPTDYCPGAMEVSLRTMASGQREILCRPALPG
jgi:tRNA threonylcarbamoyladenosine biosynthesis protein TsaE